MDTITEQDIIDELQSLYNGGDRDVVRNISYSNYNKIGAVFYTLNGSPPKGYALYIPGHHKVVFIDAWGKKRARSKFDYVRVDKYYNDSTVVGCDEIDYVEADNNGDDDD